MIRKANVEDVRNIQKLVNYHADKGEMLPRSLGDTCDNIRISLYTKRMASYLAAAHYM